MSDNGGSDLDVFDNLSKDSSPARKQTLVGMAVPPAPGSAPRTSVPPPPPSLRASMPPTPPISTVSEEEAEEIEEIEAVEDVSSPEAASAPDAVSALSAPSDTSEPSSSADAAPKPVLDEAVAEPVAADLYDDDDATQVFSGFDSSDEDETAEPPTPLAAPASSPSVSSLPLPPPPPPTGLSSGPPPPPSVTSTGASLPPLPNVMRSSGPPPAPPSPVVAAPSAPDWEEDEDDKTTVFNRESGFDAANMLMGRGSVPVGSVPDVPPPPMSRPSAPVPSPPVVSMPSGQRTSFTDIDSVPPAPANRTPLVFGAIAAIVLGIALFFMLRPTTGGLVVTVAGPGNKPIRGVEVVVDGEVACKASPCTLADLPAGTHMVIARAEGYSQTAETAVLVSSGQDAVKNIVLAQASGTGIRVTGTGQGLRLFVDGEDKGPLPQELKKMSAGIHQIKVSGEHFETWEKSVTVREEELQSLEVPKLKVVKGLAIIKGGDNAKGARVVLESDGDRRVLPSLPMNLHIDTSKPHTLVASRKGYETFREELTFENGQAEKTFEISLQRSADDGADVGSTPGPKWHATPRPKPQPEASGDATLNLNSIPASNVLLDGRPVGRTPKLGVKVSPGPHRVVFVHEGERANKSVNAKAGQTSTVVHRFK